MNIIVYTAIIGDIDCLWTTYPRTAEGVPHICFSDAPKREVGLWSKPAFGIQGTRLLAGSEDITAPTTWEVRIIEPAWSNRITARHYKAVPHRYFPDADVWIWMDGNIRLLIPPDEAVKRWLTGNMAAAKHPNRTCLFDEVKANIELHKVPVDLVTAQGEAYRAAGMPEYWGLVELGLFIRRNTPEIREFNEAWWAEMEKFGSAGQVAFPFVCWKMGIRWDIISGRLGAPNSDGFVYVKHLERLYESI